jgi:putative transcriptional regulator
MSSKVAGSIRRGLTQALAYAKHEADEADFRVHVPAQIDVRAIREKLGLTQAQFAARFAFSINTLRHWEQGKRRPEGPTRAYLQVIARTPRAVQRALRTTRYAPRATSHGLK